MARGAIKSRPATKKRQFDQIADEIKALKQASRKYPEASYKWRAVLDHLKVVRSIISYWVKGEDIDENDLIYQIGTLSDAMIEIEDFFYEMDEHEPALIRKSKSLVVKIVNAQQGI